MSETTVVHLLRHGEVHNPAKVLYGRLPGYRLSEAGEEMARSAARWFTGVAVCWARSSGPRRRSPRPSACPSPPTTG
jgi:broad specificity phosphatase PhoE